MNVIQKFSMSFVWEHSSALMAATYAIPAAIEGLKWLNNVRSDPEILKRKCVAVKQWCSDSFLRAEGEGDLDYTIKLVKNCAKVIFCVALVGGIIYASSVLFTGTMAISVALMTIYLVGEAIQGGGKITAKIVDAFTRREFESDRDYAKRVIKNICIGIVALGCIAGAAYGAYHLAIILKPLVYHALNGGYDLWRFLPKQTNLAVFLEYGILGGLHLIEAGWYYRKGKIAETEFLKLKEEALSLENQLLDAPLNELADMNDRIKECWRKARALKSKARANKARAVMHLGCAAVSIVTPFVYWKTRIGGDLLRLHHSFTGLALMLCPLSSVKFLGSMIAADSYMYGLAPAGNGYPLRGYYDQWGYFHNYDFMNLVVPNLLPIFQVFSALSVVELVRRNFFAQTPPQDEIQHPDQYERLMESAG